MASRGKGALVFVVLFALVVIGTVGGALVIVPAWVASKCVAEAAARGVTITIERTTVGLSEIHLGGVAAKLDGVTAMTIGVADVDVTLSGLSPSAVKLRGVEVAIDGSASDVAEQLDRFRAAHPSSPASPPTTLESVHVAWKNVLGPQISLDAAQGSATIDAATFHATALKVTLSTTHESFGPWRGALDTDAKGAHARVDLGADTGPHATIDRSLAGDLSLMVDVPRTHLASLGLRPFDVGLAPESSPDIATTIALTHTAARSSLDLKLDLYNATFATAPIPVDARVALSAAGAGNTLTVSHGALVVGPFDASLTGTIAFLEGAAKLDLSWRATPIPCSKLPQLLAPKTTLGQLGAALAANLTSAAKAFHVAEVTGNTVLSGKIVVDTKNMASPRLTLTTNETCGISLFP